MYASVVCDTIGVDNGVLLTGPFRTNVEVWVKIEVCWLIHTWEKWVNIISTTRAYGVAGFDYEPLEADFTQLHERCSLEWNKATPVESASEFSKCLFSKITFQICLHILHIVYL